MSESDSVAGFAVGSPLEFALRGVTNIPPVDRRGHRTLRKPIKGEYGTDVSDETANVLGRLNNAVDARELVRAAKIAGFDEVEDFEPLLTDLDDDEDADIGKAMSVLDVKLTEAWADPSQDAANAATKGNRKSIYVPELVTKAGDDGTVYMAKTLSTVAKVRMAWDLHDDNQVVVVDDYDKWEKLLGWEKLKQFPHGKNKIREELGDQLSDEVLKAVTGGKSSSSKTQKDTSSKSRGRRTRTKPSEEILNVAKGSRHRQRTKYKSEKIHDAFESNGHLPNGVSMLVLFPSTASRNMTDYWWIPGSRWTDAGYVAIANCNKGTFEYLNQRDEVWHVDDYIEQAGDYEFQSNHGPITLDTVSHDNLVMHVMSEKTMERMGRPEVFENLPEIIPKYWNEKKHTAIEWPHPDDMLYAQVGEEDMFWMRPAIREAGGYKKGGPLVLTADASVRDLPRTRSLGGDYKFYARARLPDWDFNAKELSRLDYTAYNLDLDRGGYELVETLGMLHDQGMDPYSQTPKARWEDN